VLPSLRASNYLKVEALRLSTQLTPTCLASPKYNRPKMPSFSTPTRTMLPGGPPRRAGTPAPAELEPEEDPDPLCQPINRGAADHSGHPDGEFDDFAQPPDEVGVIDDMSTLAINPAQLQRGEMAEQKELPANQTSTPALHLNGDFAELDDAAIMLELKAGNMAGFDFLIQKYRKPIINFMYRMTRNQAIAEELAQEVFLRVYRSRETYRAEARFSTWLYRIATNLGVNQARDTRHERSASTVYLDEADSDTGTTPDVADSTPDVESKLLRDERMAAIREHVMALPERQRMAVLMHKYEGMDYSQIGEVLKLSESATKSLLFRAYQTLREKLKGFV
jgi:RNA polymerase sigma-70 factor (ECF subfamily)